MEKKQIKQIEKFLKDFFKKATIETDSKVVQSKNEPTVVLISLESAEPYLLIGREGETLHCLQHLLQRIFNKLLDAELIFNVDVNNYKESRARALREMAVEIANQVALSKKEKELEPMNSFERRIIHTALAGREDVATESRGQGETRGVVVKPA